MARQTLPMTRRSALTVLSRRMVGGVALTATGLCAWANASHASGTSRRSAHSFSFPGIEGGTLTLGDFAGRAILVVNTASRCGFTNQYSDLQKLHQRYGGQGLTVLGVPSNDFGNQEPGTEADIRAFCSGTYGVTFPMTGKTGVRGASAHPFYRWARQELGAENAPRWNFHKYLVGRDGTLLAAFPSHVTPMGPSIRQAVEAALDANAS
jgi:glutathione peroxidase